MKTVYITIISIFWASLSFAQNTVNYQYDNENRIILSDDGTKVQQYTYDNLGNRTSYTITATTGLPDLNVTNANIANTNITQGQTYVVSCTINNLQNVDAIASTLKVHLSPTATGTELEVGTYSVPSITANGNENINFNIIIPSSATLGSQNLVFFIDAITTISETDETNNKQSIAVTVSEPALAELNVQNAIVSPNTIQAGNSVNLTADIFNEGTVDATNFNVKCFLSNNPTYESNDVLLTDATEIFSTLSANSNVPFNKTVLIPSNTVAGNYYLLFVVDTDNTVTEINETNNVASVSLVVSTTSGSTTTSTFSANNTNVAIGDTVQFIDQSTNNPTSWQWTFEGGTPSTSTQQNPEVTYNTLGAFDVTLDASNASGDSTELKTDYITVSECQSDWNYVGTSGFSSDGLLGFELDSNNIPYVLLKDTNNKTTVMKFNNGSWDLVGASSFSHVQIAKAKLKIDNNDNLFVGYIDVNSDNKISVKKFDGTSWVNVGTLNFSGRTDYSFDMAIDNNGFPSVIYEDGSYAGSSGLYWKLMVMKFNGSSWVYATTVQLERGNYLDIEFDNNNVLHAAYSQDEPGEPSYANVKKLVGSNWITVGSENFSSAEAEYLNLKFDSNNTAYIVYRGSGYSKKTVVKKLISNSWSNIGTPGFSPDGQTWLHKLEFSNNDVPFISFRYYESSTGSSTETIVMKYESSTWQTVGNTNTSTYSLLLDLDNNSIPYIAYNDLSNSGEGSVKKFACNSTLEVNFYANPTAVPVGSVVDFLDISTSNPISWSWSFSPDTVTYINGTDSSSQNPKVTFNNEGMYSVTLIASNSEGSDTETKTDYITVDNTLSIDGEELSSILIYPNPTDNLIYIENSLGIKIKRIKIYDLTGKLLNRIEDNPQSISLKSYANGVYLIQIKSDNGKVIKRIIKK